MTASGGYAPWAPAKQLLTHSPNLDDRSDLYSALNMHSHKNDAQHMHQLCWTSSWLYFLAYLRAATNAAKSNENIAILICNGPILVASLFGPVPFNVTLETNNRMCAERASEQERRLFQSSEVL